MSHDAGALAWAEAQVAAARDDPAARVALMARVFHGPTGDAPRHLPFRRAALSFMRWQARRGVLNPVDGSPPGSVWWRAMHRGRLSGTPDPRGIREPAGALLHERRVAPRLVRARTRRGAAPGARAVRSSRPRAWRSPARDGRRLPLTAPRAPGP